MSPTADAGPSGMLRITTTKRTVMRDTEPIFRLMSHPHRMDSLGKVVYGAQSTQDDLLRDADILSIRQMGARIEVEKTGDAPLRFRVTVGEGRGRTQHDMTLDEADYERLKGSATSPEEFVRRCFEFLLAREPKESILSSFDVSVISRYFTEFEREIAKG